jgi:hypothetical protein
MVYIWDSSWQKRSRGEKNKRKAQTEMSSIRPPEEVHRHFVGGPASGK